MKLYFHGLKSYSQNRKLVLKFSSCVVKIQKVFQLNFNFHKQTQHNIYSLKCSMNDIGEFFYIFSVVGREKMPIFNLNHHMIHFSHSFNFFFRSFLNESTLFFIFLSYVMNDKLQINRSLDELLS